MRTCSTLETETKRERSNLTHWVRVKARIGALSCDSNWPGRSVSRRQAEEEDEKADGVRGVTMTLKAVQGV